jgi:hypothetical protein
MPVVRAVMAQVMDTVREGHDGPDDEQGADDAKTAAMAIHGAGSFHR